jgi:spore germination cell wall hydrolase CwlJ-like protein
MSGIDFNADPDIALKRQFAALLMKQGMDTSPVQHWTQGAARLAQALVAKKQMGELKEEGTKTRKTLADTLLGNGAAEPASPAAPAQPLSPTSNTAGKVYANNEASPLDPPGGTERDMLARALLAEAGNQGPQGMQAVANVVRNRAVSGQFGGDTPSGVLQKPSQFEPFNTEQGRAKMAGMDPNSPQFQQALVAIDRAYTGDDPTKGATHFYAPKAQAALGRDAPKWDNGQGRDIGDHRFFGGAGGPQVTAGMSPTDVSAQRAAPQQSSPQRNAPQIPPEMAGRIRALIENPATTQYGLQLASQFIKPSQPTHGVIGKDQFGNEQYGWIDPTNRSVTPAPMPGGQAQQPMSVTGPDGNPIPIPQGVNPKKFRDDVTGTTADAASGKMTESQGKASQYAGRMENAEAQLQKVEQEGTAAGQRAWSAADNSLGAAGFGIPRGQMTEGFKTFDTARSQWVTALLRRDSGAVINADEFKRYDREFFPQPGDGPQQIAQKRQARQIAMENMKKEAGGSYKSPQMQSQGPQIGTVEDGYVFLGGNPADRNSWRRQ